MKPIKNLDKIAFLSTYPPIECGIATFTEDLVTAINSKGFVNTSVVAINNSKSCSYGNDVIYEINKNKETDYVELSKKLSKLNINLLVIQHEYGIFGGSNGEFILSLINNIDIPVITTLHTVLENPTQEQKSIIAAIVNKSNKIITMAQNTFYLLKSVYKVNPIKIELIHHGVPRKSVESREALKKKFNYENTNIISTFGFVSPGKGIEYGIEAISEVVKYDSKVKYLILGQTHPNLKNDGLIYQRKLEKLVKDLKLDENVIFVNKYLTKDEIITYLQMSDVYITPYVGKEQAVSGTLAYAAGYGKAIVSTPYLYAKEMLANGRGLLADFNNPDSIADCINYLLKNPKAKKSIEKKMQLLGNTMYWDIVANNYIKVITNSISQSDKVGVV